MAGSELAKKLKLKPGARAAVIGAPEGYLAELEPLPEGVSLSTRLAEPLDWLQVFVTTRAELAKLAAKAAAALKPVALLWISVGLQPAAVPPRGTAAEKPLDGIV
jgi:hypothetical protein